MTDLAAPPVRHRRIFDGWFVVAASFLMLMASAGLGFYALGVYLEAVTREKGFGTGAASFGSSIFFVVAGLMGQVVGRLVGRHDLRTIVVAGALVAGSGLALLGYVETLCSSTRCTRCSGPGWRAPHSSPRWAHPHPRRRVDAHGLAGTTVWLGVLYVVVVVPAVLCFLWPDPMSRGQLLDGDEVEDAPVGSVDPRLLVDAMSVPYDAAVRSRVFVVVSASFVLTLGAQIGGIGLIVKLASDRLDRGTGADAVSVIAIVTVLWRLATGTVMHRLPLVAVTIVVALIQGVSLMMMGVADDRTDLLIAALLMGIFGRQPRDPATVAHRRGLRRAGLPEDLRVQPVDQHSARAGCRTVHRRRAARREQRLRTAVLRGRGRLGDWRAPPPAHRRQIKPTRRV